MLSQDAIGKVALNALSAMAKIFLVSCVGIVCSKYPRDSPLLPVGALKYLSRLSNLVLLPALIIVSLGSALSVSTFARLSVLIMFSMLINLISYTIAYTLGYWLIERDNGIFTAASVAIGSPNAISLPLMVMQTMCEQPLVNADFNNETQRCFTEANSMLFVYSIGWHLMFWSYGFPMLKTLCPGGPVDVAAKGKHSLESILVLCRQWVVQVFLSPSMLAIFVGIFIGLVDVLQNAMFKDFTILRPVGSSLRTLSEPVVCLNCLVTSANLAQVDISPIREMGRRALTRAGQIFVSVDGNSSMWSRGTGADKSSHSPIPVEENDHNSPPHTSSPLHCESELSPVDDGESKGDQAEGCVVAVTPSSGMRTQESSHSLPQGRTIAGFLLCRLILPSLIILPVLRLAVDGGIIAPREKLMQLVICIEVAAPSAQLIIVSLSQLGLQRVASQMSYLYVYQYLFSIITITCWTSVAMSLIY